MWAALCNQYVESFEPCHATRQSHFISCTILQQHGRSGPFCQKKAEGNFVNVLLCWIQPDFLPVGLNTSWLSVCKQIALVRKSYRGFSHCLWSDQYWRGGGPGTSFEDRRRRLGAGSMMNVSCPCSLWGCHMLCPLVCLMGEIDQVYFIASGLSIFHHAWFLGCEHDTNELWRFLPGMK